MRASPSRRLAVLVTALVAIVAAVPASSATAAASAPRDGFRKVGYFTQWGIYGRAFYVKNLDTSGAAARLTHVNYAFANVSEDGRCFEDNLPGAGDAWADYQRPVQPSESVDGVGDDWGEPLNGNFGQLLKLKAKHPDLKVLLSIGGWTWSTYFSNAALTPQSRAAFVASCIDLFLKGNLPVLEPDGSGSGGPGSAYGVFDGFDLDWEWPNWPGEEGNVIRAEDKQNFTALLAEFRSQLDAYGSSVGRHFELTAFLPANPAAMDAGFEGDKIFNHLDFATVQGYDFHGTWESRTNQQSALRQPLGAPDKPDFTGDYAIKSWLARGAPRTKLVLGIPYYGRGWTGVIGGGDGLYQQSTGAAKATWEDGYEDYKVLASLPGRYTVHRDWQAGHAWLFDGNTFWTFDDPLVLAQKTQYIRRERLGGAMVWSLDGDTSDAILTKTIAFGLRGP